MLRGGLCVPGGERMVRSGAQGGERWAARAREEDRLASTPGGRGEMARWNRRL